MQQRSYFIKIRLPKTTQPRERELFSLLLSRTAAGFSFQGMEDWQVDTPNGVKVLGVEREFHDLTRAAAPKPEIKVYFRLKSDAGKFQRIVHASFADVQVFPPERLVPRDWMKLWRKHYRTQILREGKERLEIVPAWVRRPRRASVVQVKIHPGQAFGTGTHPTTRLCLRLFLRAQRKFSGQTLRVLDFGAGTGVLALAAEQWTKARKISFAAELVESDPVALAQARKNARLNRSRIAKFQRKISARRKFDFVFANVLAPVLIERRKELAAATAPGGLLVVSGILRKEGGDFLHGFRSESFKLVGVLAEGDWIAYMFRGR